ncbi:hypothetical protein tinsulaeT_28130 [Thalassotalea insulae]|uniref:General stress protein CsbD n=1 Tax=Thalassotalea insulae TaxID=2056778 RepID=A0ABQ6GU62_9GAMM|nr:hypothetical protein [Thalassotalea insulae]GLX79473.1 hypothetical protein tinsulaeT_28130 [Thalassotalea insulae]
MTKNYENKSTPRSPSSMTQVAKTASPETQIKQEAKNIAVWSKKQVNAAKDLWKKLTEEELVKTAGNKKKLADMIETRYAITHDAADKQVNGFFTKHHI